MKRKTKNRFEELFTAELLLQRVYLHLRQSERTNAHAVFAVAMRHQAIIEEREQLKQQLNERGQDARGRTGKAD